MADAVPEPTSANQSVMPSAGTPSAAPFVPAGTTDLDRLRRHAAACRGCDLYRDATQTVFGAGPTDARVIMVGEQPGDVEDRRGLPFVGPAGKVLDRAVKAAGLDRWPIYVTNAVKHFKHRPSGPGKRRIHQTPDQVEIVACRPWLMAELASVRPTAVVVLGATAAKALLGPSLATIHPSAVLRADDRERAYAGVVADLRVVAAELAAR